VEIDGLVYWTVGAAVSGATRERPAHLLPIYDEYLVAYRDRVAVPHGSAALRSFRAGEPFVFRHPLLIAGQVAGTWKVTPRPKALSVDVVPSRRLTVRERRELAAAARRYEDFMGTPISVSVRT
jgi:hypothetical protein